MPFVKLRLEATAAGQNIDNILYYCNDDGGELFFDAGEMAAFGAAWLTEFGTEWANGLPSIYNLNAVSVSMVNERGLTVSDYEVPVPADVPGAQSSNVDTVALYAVLRFYTTTNPTMGGRPMKRSYLAYGPLSSEFVNSDGSLTTAGIAQLDDALVAVSSPLSFGGGDKLPCRIGRTTAPAPLAVAPVAVATLAPYARWRDSRSRNASGT